MLPHEVLDEYDKNKTAEVAKTKPLTMHLSKNKDIIKSKISFIDLDNIIDEKDEKIELVKVLSILAGLGGAIIVSSEMLKKLKWYNKNNINKVIEKEGEYKDIDRL